MKKLIQVLAVTLLVSLNAKATTLYTFDFVGDNTGVSEEYLYQQGDLLLSVTAWTANVNGDQDVLEDWFPVFGGPQLPLGVYNGSSGLGVVSSPFDGEHLDGGSSGDFLDDPDEGLLFLFSETVNLFDIGIGSLGSDDDFNLSIVELTFPFFTTNDVIVDQGRPANDREVNFDFGNGFQGSAFLVWVDGNDDDIRIRDISVTVPEPHGLALLLTAGMGMLLVRRRR